MILMTLLSACGQKSADTAEDFIFLTENIDGDEGYYSKPAIITGDIAHRDVYPNTKEVSITLPFYDRVDNKQTSMIFDDRFAFSLLPYATRTVSMKPFIDHLVICPGDSLHIEIDFAELGKVRYSGKGADNNIKLNLFHLRYYLPQDWPDEKQHADAKSYSDAAKGKLEYHLSRLEDFVNEVKPSDELEKLFAPLSLIKVPVHEMAMMMSIALRFIPTLAAETDKIMKAQQARGADFESGNLLQNFINTFRGRFLNVFTG